MFGHHWARKDLQRGDLTALLELIEEGRWGNPNEPCIQRLSQRGFVQRKNSGRLRVTMKGRAALLLGWC